METPPTTPVSLFSRGWAAVTGRKKKGKRHGLQIRSVPNNAHSCRQYMQLILISWCCNIYPPQLLLQLIRYPAAKLPTPNIKQCHLQSTGVGSSSCSCASILIFRIIFPTPNQLQCSKATRRPTALGVDLIEDLPSSPTHFQIANNYNPRDRNPSEDYTAQVMQISPRRLPANPLAPTVHAPPNIEGRRKESSVSAHEYASVGDPRRPSSLMEQHGEYSEVADRISITTAHEGEFESDAYPSIDADPDPLARGGGGYSRLQSNLPFLSQTEREWNGMAPTAVEGESPYSTLSPRALHGRVAPSELHVLTIETVVVGGVNSSSHTHEFERSGPGPAAGVHDHGHGHDAAAAAASTNQHVEQVLTQPVDSGGYEVAVPRRLQAKAHLHAAGFESGGNAAQQPRWSLESDEGPNVHTSGSSGVGAGGYSKLGARTKGSFKSGGGGGGGAKRDGKTDRSHYSRLDRLAPPPVRGIARLSTAGAHVDDRSNGFTSVGASASTSAIGGTAQKTPQHVQLRLGKDLGVIRSSVYSMYGFEGNIMASNGQTATAVAAAATKTLSILANNTGDGTAAAAAATANIPSTPPLSSTKQNNLYEEPADALVRCSVYSIDGNSGGGGDDNDGDGYLAIGDGTSGGSGSNSNGVGGGFSAMHNERQYAHAHADLTDDSDAESSGGSSHGGGGGSQWGFGDSIAEAAEPVAIASESAANNYAVVNDGFGGNNTPRGNSNTTNSNHGNHLTNGAAAAAAAAATSSCRDTNGATLTSTLSFQPVEFTVTPASPTSPTAEGGTLRAQSVRRQNPLFAHQQKLAKENRRKVMANEEDTRFLSTRASSPSSTSSPSSPLSSTSTCTSVPQQQPQQSMTRNLSYLNALTADGGGSSGGGSSSSGSGVARDGNRYVRPKSERPTSSDSTGFC